MKKILIVIILCLGFLTACSKQGQAKKTGAVGIRDEIKRGPVSVLVTSDKKAISVADNVTFNISVIAGEDYDIELPNPEGKLDKFEVIDFTTVQKELLDDGRVKVSRSYVLEPFLAGSYVIPPLKIYFNKKGAASDKRHLVETGKYKIFVTSVLPEDAKGNSINDIVDPVALPYSVMTFVWILLAVIVLILIVVAFIIIHRRNATIKEQQAIIIPPHEIALKALDDLRAEDLPGNGQIKLFYQRVSSILRIYIEDRFGLRAPEQTTEEFLVTLQETSALPRQYQSLLETFLKHCDLVKFAELHPNEDEIKKTFESCRAFVVGTIRRQEV